VVDGGGDEEGKSWCRKEGFDSCWVMVFIVSVMDKAMVVATMNIAFRSSMALPVSRGG